MDKYKIDQEHQVERFISSENSYREILINRFGTRYLTYREFWKKVCNGSLILNFPLHIDLDTIDACNLKCDHCQEENTRQRTLKRMSHTLIDRFFEEVEEHKLCALNIGTVGEPLLAPETLFYIIEKAGEYGVMETFVHTNAQLLNRKISEEILESGLTYLCISVDAASNETYRKIRGANYEELKQKIFEFKDLKNRNKLTFPLLRLSFLSQILNMQEKQQFLEQWSKIADFIDFQPLINYHNYTDRIVNTKSQCFNPFMRLMIGTSGEIGACCAGISFNEDMILGYFPETTIYEAWNGVRINDLRNSMNYLRLDNYPTCIDCLKRR